jgi:hypothetical protein
MDRMSCKKKCSEEGDRKWERSSALSLRCLEIS